MTDARGRDTKLPANVRRATRLVSTAVVWLIAAVAAAQGPANGLPAPPPGSLPGMRPVAPLADGQWTMPAGDYGNLRYSPLNKINTQNVQNLHVVATQATGIAHGHEGQPLVVNGMLHMVTPFPNTLLALNITKPGFPMKWSLDPHPNGRAVGIACCDTVNRGASFADGKVIYDTLDAHTVAVDANTGKMVWETQVGDIKLGETETMAPVIIRDTVLVGISGGELGARGKVTALDVKTGKMKWRAYTTGSDADVLFGADFKPFYAKVQGKDLGLKSWVPISGSAAAARFGAGSALGSVDAMKGIKNVTMPGGALYVFAF